MKRLIALFALCSLIFSGCMNSANYETYMKAVEKTENIKRGSISIDVEVEQDGEKVDEMIKFTMDGYFNEEKDQGIFDIYFNKLEYK